MEFFRQLFNSTEFQPHGFCYLWNSRLIWLHVASDLLIAVAYFTIPVTLIQFVRKRRDLPFSWIFVLFGIFIVACGTTHVMEVWNLWHAAYWFAGILKAVTAAASILTAFLLARLIPQAVGLRSSADWIRANEALKKEIEERTLLESELRSSIEQQRETASLLEITHDAIFVRGPHSEILFWNRAAEELYGWSKEEVRGRTTLQLLNTEFPIPLADIETHTMTKGFWEGELIHHRRDGSAITVLSRWAPRKGPDGGLAKILESNNDISARKKEQEELRLANLALSQRVKRGDESIAAAGEALSQTQERLAMALRAGRIGTWELDIATRKSSWSVELEEIFGLAPGQYDGRHETWRKLVHPDDVDAAEADLQHVSESNRLFQSKYRIVVSCGETRWVSARGQIVPEEKGRPIRMAGVIVDVTEQELAHQQIHSLNASLELRVLERTTELANANKELESFSYSVSHDLRAPLRSIDGFSHALMEDCAGILNEEGKKHLQRIRSATQRMGLLIDDLLRLSKLTRSELRRRTVDLSALVKSVAEELLKSQPRRTVDLQIEPGIVVTGDPGLLRVVLENLISNALKFTGKREAAHIAFGKKDSDGTTSYFVSDDGAGFDPAYADRLFGAFQRLHGATEFPGTGVGLATVQRVIHRHGGTIRAKSSVDHGATFYFTLPSQNREERSNAD